jgi:hypothetical protein
MFVQKEFKNAVMLTGGLLLLLCFFACGCKILSPAACCPVRIACAVVAASCDRHVLLAKWFHSPFCLA